MAGGSLSNVKMVDSKTLSAIATMKPFKTTYYGLANEGKDYLIYHSSADAIDLDLSKLTGVFSMKIINAQNGSVLREEKVKAGAMLKINKVSANDEVIVIHKI
ncbi:hypothetical protein D9M68_934620 [compost metagenome]